jgi:hypothetical protein
MLMLRLQKREVSTQTAEAVKQISTFMAMLSKYFYLDERDELFKDKD